MIKIEAATEKDLEAISKIHFSSFQGLFASELGQDFLREFYRTILSSDEGVCYVARDNLTIKGFICGVANKTPFTPSLKVKFIYWTIKRLILSPRSIVNLLRFIKKLLLTRDIQTNAELIAIVVTEDCRKKGIGKSLVEKFFSFLSERDVQKVKVFTDARYESACFFYEALRFTLVKSIDLFGMECRCYEKVI